MGDKSNDGNGFEWGPDGNLRLKGTTPPNPNARRAGESWWHWKDRTSCSGWLPWGSNNPITRFVTNSDG